MKKQFVTNLDEDVIKNLKRIALELDTNVNVLIECSYHYIIHNQSLTENYKTMIDYCKKNGYIE